QRGEGGLGLLDHRTVGRLGEGVHPLLGREQGVVDVARELARVESLVHVADQLVGAGGGARGDVGELLLGHPFDGDPRRQQRVVRARVVIDVLGAEEVGRGDRGGGVHVRPHAGIRLISRSRSRNCCTAVSRDARISSAVPTARILACHKSATRSATRNEPRTSCDTTTLVTPSSSRSRSTSPSITSAFTGSSPEVGSSYRRYLGCPAIARAIPTRFFIPPDSSAGSLAATSGARFTSRRHSCIRFSQNFSSL